MDIPRKGEENLFEPRTQYLTEEQEHFLYSVLRDQEKNDLYVQEIQALYRKNASFPRHTRRHFASAVKNVEQKLKNTAPFCEDLQAKVLECYRANPGDILNCSEIVSAFTTCVDRARIDMTLTHIKKMKLLESLNKIADAEELMQPPDAEEVDTHIPKEM